LKVGMVTRNEKSFCSIRLRRAFDRRRIPYACFNFPQLTAHVGYKPYVKVVDFGLPESLDALLVRPIGRGSLEELVFRMDVLYRLQRLGMCVINPPEAIEHCVDKYDVLAILEEKGIPVPRTAVTESVDKALLAFKELGGDVVVKPIFGSRGVGSTRINDPEVAAMVFRSITFYHGALYVQEFVEHGLSDVRAFVVGNRVVASMRRVAKGWKTNYSQGAKPHAVTLDRTLEETSVKSAEYIGCMIAGVDILEGQNGPMVVDINSQPGWRGLQSVSSVDIAGEIADFVVSQIKR
jgi:RimK family alpha-L-glutamate ligase